MTPPTPRGGDRVRQGRLWCLNRKVAVRERVSVPRCVVAATQPGPQVAECAVNNRIRLPVVVLEDLLPGPRSRLRSGLPCRRCLLLQTGSSLRNVRGRSPSSSGAAAKCATDELMRPVRSPTTGCVRSPRASIVGSTQGGPCRPLASERSEVRRRWRTPTRGRMIEIDVLRGSWPIEFGDTGVAGRHQPNGQPPP